MAAIIHRARWNFNVDEADGVSRRHTWFWALLDLALLRPRPRPLSINAVTAVLKVHRIRRLTVDTVRAALQVPPVPVAPGTIEAACAHIALLLPRLRLVHDQRTRILGIRIDQVMTALAKEDGTGEHRDVTILRSLPGVGRLVAATVLAEASRPLAERDYQTLRTHAGSAPVTRRSGKKAVVSTRQACNPACATPSITGRGSVSKSTPAVASTMIASANADTNTLGPCAESLTDRSVF